MQQELIELFGIEPGKAHIEVRILEVEQLRRQSSASRTDWQIVNDFFERHRDRFTTSWQVGSSNPPVKDRTNCVNAMLRNQAGLQRLFLDPSCQQLLQDFERVHWKTDGNGKPLGEIDKSDPARTHVSDALGYMIAQDFGMYPLYGYRSERII